MRQAQVQRVHASNSLRNYKQTFNRQASLNTRLHVFVKMCEVSYMGPNTAEHQIDSPVQELCKQMRDHSVHLHLASL